MTKQLDDKIRPYRILITNVDVKGSDVEKIAKEELGDVKLVNWEIEKEIMDFVVEGGNLLQRETIVKLNYQEFVEGEK